MNEPTVAELERTLVRLAITNETLRDSLVNIATEMEILRRDNADLQMLVEERAKTIEELQNK